MPKRSRPQAVRTPTKRQLTKWQRERRARRFVIIAAAFIIALVLAIPAYGYYKEVYAKGREAIAVVDNKALSMNDYVRLLSLRQYQLDLGLNYLKSQGVDQSGGFIEQLQMQRAVLPTQVVFDWVDGEVIVNSAPKLGVAVSSGDVWQEMKKQFLGDPKPDETVDEAKRDADAQERLKGVVDATGISADEYRRTVEVDLIRQKVDQYLRDQIVTPTLQANVQIIQTNGEEEIQNAYKRIRDGEDFAKVAQEISVDGQSKEKGGELGWVPKGLRSREFDDAVFAMSTGQLSEPFKSSEGYYIVKMLGRDEARDLDDSTLEIVKSGAMQRWLAEEKGKVKTDYRITSDKQFWAQEKVSKEQVKRAKNALPPLR